MVEGVLYLPDGVLNLEIAGAGPDVWNAQLVVRRVTVEGSAGLDLLANSRFAATVYISRARLIR